LKERRNILVTGGAGFIGSHLVEQLLAENIWRVTVMDDFNDFYDPLLKRANAAPHLGRDDYELIEADIRDRRALEEFSRPRALIASCIWRRAPGCALL
jgi:UDP-glucuronate 4-epimerase